MTKEHPNTPHWVKLDNAAKIYPAARRKGWSNLFRLSATLHEPVDASLLQQALNVTVGRFPSIAAQLRRGAFWFYLQQVHQAPPLSREYSYPLVHMNRKEMRKCAFRVIAHRDRIAVEFFHSLTDATGGLIFLKSLLAEYLEQKHSIRIPCTHGVLDRKEPPREEELRDLFPQFAAPVCATRKDSNAWRLSGDPLPEGELKLVCFRLELDRALRKAHEYGATLSVFFAAVMMQALLQMQCQQVPDQTKRKPVKILIPVDLRKLYRCETLRNFAMYVVPQIHPRLGSYSFREICKLVSSKLTLEANAKHMSTMIATNVRDERRLVVRFIPLPLKNLIMKTIFNQSGEKKSCLCMSNIGRVEVPEEMASYIRGMDFILGPQSTGPYNCGLVSWGSELSINFIRDIREPELERHFHQILQDMGLTATVQTNES